MTDGEYEEAYREALLIARELVAGDVNEGPVIVEGARMANVDGRPMTDHQVFKLAWGERIAEQIRKERSHDLGER